MNLSSPGGRILRFAGSRAGRGSFFRIFRGRLWLVSPLQKTARGDGQLGFGSDRLPQHYVEFNGGFERSLESCDVFGGIWAVRSRR